MRSPFLEHVIVQLLLHLLIKLVLHLPVYIITMVLRGSTERKNYPACTNIGC